MIERASLVKRRSCCLSSPMHYFCSCGCFIIKVKEGGGLCQDEILKKIKRNGLTAGEREYVITNQSPSFYNDQGRNSLSP